MTLAAVAGASAVTLALVIAVQTYLNVKKDLAAHGLQLGRAMAPVLTNALRHDDVWLAYTSLQGGRERVAEGRRPALVVVDRNGRIFAANQPRRYPTARRLSRVAPSLAAALAPAAEEDGEADASSVAGQFVQRVPLVVDTAPRGYLLVSFPPQAYWDRFWAIIGQGALYTVGVMALSGMAGVYLGRRLVRPLMRLSACMGRVGREPLQSIHCSLPTGDDELGRLAAAFQRMLQDLRYKEALEQQMVSSERLAAVGRLAAGVAHEINNPLAGMLVALDTLRTYGDPDPRTLHTIHQLERGLEQIRETVGALLLEARREPRNLTPQDLEDVRTLVVSQRPGDRVHLEWDNRLRESISLPSTLVRQILLNLLLNAVQAAGEGGAVRCRVEQNAYAMLIQVENESETLRPEVLDRLFEPYVTSREEGRGLGLWVTYQLVRQLQGSVAAESEGGWIRFHVQLPVLEEEADAGTGT